MTLVEASWQDPSGALQTAPARMEDKSAGGACIRIKIPILVGAKLTIQWRFEQFSGTAKYCRGDGRDYLVGIQRDTTNPVPLKPAAPVSPQKAVGAPPPPPIKTQAPPQRPKEQPVLVPAARRDMAPAPAHSPATDAAGREQKPAPAIDRRDRLRLPRLPDLDARAIRHRTKSSPQSGNERKSMARKWLELPWHHHPEVRSVSAPPIADATSKPNPGNNHKENPMPHAAQATDKAPAQFDRELPSFQVELLPMEDIYRAAGIMVPPKGYSIQKVVAMLTNEHMSGLPKDTKRAAVLMALDAAGVPLDQIEQDARARRSALDFHEAQQKKQVETEWARKAEEVVQIQAELESTKAHYMARISRNLEGVAREKATFNNWVALKQQECQDMAEAIELCLKAPVSEPAGAPVAEIGMARAASAAASDAATKDSRRGEIN